MSLVKGHITARANYVILPLIFGFYLASIVTAHYSAFWLRFGGKIPEWESMQLMRMLPWLVVIRGISFIFYRICIGSQFYTKISGWLHTVIWTASGTLVFYALVRLGFGLSEYPRLVFIFDTIFLILFMQGIRAVQLIWKKVKPDRMNVVKSDVRESTRNRALGGWQINADVRDYMVALILLASIGGIFAVPQIPAVHLPFDRTNSVIYDNDETIDAYTDEYLMTLASVGEINLVGMITSSSITPYNRHVTPSDYERMLDERWKGVLHARNSGLKNIPEPVRGPMGHLREPESGVIADTSPIASEGSWLILNEARKTTRSKPLVIVMGGPLTVVADAYLLDNSIADKLIVSWIGGERNYNGWADTWAEYIALEKLRMVQFLAREQDAPVVPKEKLSTMPNTELRQWMLSKEHPVEPLPGGHDGDGPAAICMMCDDYVLHVKRVSFSHWITHDGHNSPSFKNDPNGKTLIVTRVSQAVATEEFWRAITNPAAYSAMAMRRR